MNDLKLWITANKLLTGAIAIFIILLGLLSWLTYSGWDSLSGDLASYAQTKSDLDALLK